MASATAAGGARGWGGPAFADRGTFLSLLAFALCLCGWAWAVTGSPPPARAVLLCLVWPAVALRAGRALTAALGLGAAFALPFVVGNAALALGLMLVKLTVPVPTPVAVWAGLGLAWFVPRLLPDRRPQRDPFRTPAGELFAVLLCLAAATAWNRFEFPPTAAAGETVVYKPWSDHFTHATLVARMLERDPIPRIGNYECKGLPALAYHYASYAFPAAYAAVARCSAYDSLCAVWVPLGLALLGLSAYALGRTLWGHGAGLGAVAGALLLPDTLALPVANPMLGYFNILVVGPASLYGIAVAASALVAVADGARRGDRRGLAGALALAASVVCFKLHVFLASFPLTVGLAILTCRGVSPGRRALALAAAGLVAALAIGLNDCYEFGPAMRPSLEGGGFYFRALAGQPMAKGYGERFRVFLAEGGFRAHFGRAALLLSLTTFGAFVLLYPLTLLAALRRRSLRSADLIPLGAAAIYLAMALGLPENRVYGSPEELQHRQFVWAYFVVAGLTAARLVALLGARLPDRVRALGPALCVALLAVPAGLGGAVHHQRTTWGVAGTEVKLPRGLVACARFIRHHGPVSALVQDSDLGEQSHILSSLAQRRAFLAHPDDWASIHKRRHAGRCAEARRQLEALKQARTAAELRAGVQATGIRWYLQRPGACVAWPPELRDRSAFEADGYRVYDLRALLRAPVERAGSGGTAVPAVRDRRDAGPTGTLAASAKR